MSLDPAQPLPLEELRNVQRYECEETAPRFSYESYRDMCKNDYGDFVLYEDYEKALSALAASEKRAGELDRQMEAYRTFYDDMQRAWGMVNNKFYISHEAFNRALEDLADALAPSPTASEASEAGQEGKA